jgi:hypothetical protein
MTSRANTGPYASSNTNAYNNANGRKAYPDVERGGGVFSGNNMQGFAQMMASAQYSLLPPRRAIWFYVILFLMIGFSLLLSWICVAFLEDNASFQTYYGTEIIIVGALAIIAASMYGLHTESERFRALARIYTDMEDTVADIFLLLPPPQALGQSQPPVFVDVDGRRGVQMTLDRVINEATGLLVLALVTIYWEIAYLRNRRKNGDDAQFTVALSEFQSQLDLFLAKFTATRQAVMASLREQQKNDLRAGVLLDQAFVLAATSRREINPWMLENIRSRVKELKKDILRVITADIGAVVLGDSILFRIVGIVYLLGAPFVLLPGCGHYLLAVYPVLVAFVGYWFVRRWFVGDVYERQTDFHGGIRHYASDRVMQIRDKLQVIYQLDSVWGSDLFVAVFQG